MSDKMREVVLQILHSYKQEMERYGYYGSNPGVSVEDFDDIANEIAAWQAAQSAAVPVVGEVIPQDWDGIDGAVAWHLIDRHGEGWSQIGQMMGEWLKANSIDSAKLALLLRCEAALEVLMEECKSSNDCQYGTLSTSHIIGIIDAAIAGEKQ